MFNRQVAEQNKKVRRISSLSNLPPPVEGEIILPNNKLTYFLLEDVDLEGNTLILGENTFKAFSPEYHGFKNGSVLVNKTCLITDFKFTNIETIVDTTNDDVVYKSCNFFNSPNCILVQTCGNLLLENMGFVNSSNLILSGTFDSLVIDNKSIFRGSVIEDSVYIEVLATAVINRRLRIGSTVFQTDFATQKCIKFNPGFTIGDERFILENSVLFQGIGTALDGINGDNIKALFSRVEGGNSKNSTRSGRMYLNSNSTPTVITVPNQAIKIDANFLIDLLNTERFEYDEVQKCLICKSPVKKRYLIISTFTISANANKKIGAYVCVCLAGNTITPEVDKLANSENYIPSATGARPDSLAVVDSVDLSFGDKVYVSVENSTDMTSVTVEQVNLILQSPV